MSHDSSSGCRRRTYVCVCVCVCARASEGSGGHLLASHSAPVVKMHALETSHDRGRKGQRQSAHTRPTNATSTNKQHYYLPHRQARRRIIPQEIVIERLVRGRALGRIQRQQRIHNVNAGLAVDSEAVGGKR